MLKVVLHFVQKMDNIIVHHFLENKMEEYAPETVADDYLAEVKIGGYDVCHDVFFHDTNGEYCGL